MIIFFTIFTSINLIIYFKREFFIKWFNIYDLPDSNRKQHKTKVSVFGGSIVLINLIILLFFILFSDYKFSEIIENNRNLFSIFIISIFVYIVGLFDDKLLIKNNVKFLSLMVLIFLSLLIDNEIILNKINFSWINREILLLNFSLTFTVLCILTFMNSFNFLDGIDLLCGLYALIIFLIFFYLTESIFFIPFIFSLIIFCVLNYKKRLFLGNSGAFLISFLISIFMIKTYKLNIIQTEQIIIIFLLPILDNLRVFYVRFINKRNILLPDNNHLHHLLIKKFNNLTAVSIILTIIFIPYLISNFLSIFYSLIVIQIIIYYLIIYKFKKIVN